MTTHRERWRSATDLIRSADAVTRAVTTRPAESVRLDLDRDVWAETVAATGIDPEVER